MQASRAAENQVAQVQDPKSRGYCNHVQISSLGCESKPTLRIILRDLSYVDPPGSDEVHGPPRFVRGKVIIK